MSDVGVTVRSVYESCVVCSLGFMNVTRVVSATYAVTIVSFSTVFLRASRSSKLKNGMKRLQSFFSWY